ncbi:hypothetical protein E3N88_31715 [Mikania micrantha]|uniref:Uncharacterized protein n=1 Tax=Mikania micrantha TaxID=192012 RepID=A0A5N6M6Z8_9ASTR|nr:hypothetical protein E3N88_31715 [Mikania micrantha]
MLQIRLSNKSVASESGGGAKLPSGETVTVACPDHLVLAELPVAKSLGAASGVTLVKTVGRRSRRPLGERVHFCVRCDFPIAIYGRLVVMELPSLLEMGPEDRRLGWRVLGRGRFLRGDCRCCSGGLFWAAATMAGEESCPLWAD